MDVYIRAGSAQDILHYDCRPYNNSPEYMNARGSENVMLGVLFIGYGVTAEVSYIFALIAMLTKELRRLSCYKIMAILGIYDMLAISVNSLITGYLWMIGAWYCTHPDLIYISGAFGLALWCGACMNCFVLVVNRLIDLWKPHLVNKFYNYPHTVNNLLIVVATCILYSFVVGVLMKMFRLQKHPGMRIVTNNELSIIFQATAICMANLIAAIIYVYMQFFRTSKWLVLIGHMSWQAGHGLPAFVYLLMNKTIQFTLRRMFCKWSLRRIDPSTTYGGVCRHGTRTEPLPTTYE